MRASPLSRERRSESMNARLPLAKSSSTVWPGVTTAVLWAPSGAITRMWNWSRGPRCAEYQDRGPPGHVEDRIGQAHRLEIEQPGHRRAVGQHVHRREVAVGEHHRSLREEGRHTTDHAGKGHALGGRKPSDLLAPASRASGEAAGIGPQVVELE